MNEYQVFIDHGRAKYDPKPKRITNAPQGYQKIKEHLVFACKHNRCHKARLVAGGHQTSDPIWSSFNNIPKTINIPSQIKQHESHRGIKRNEGQI